MKKIVVLIVVLMLGAAVAQTATVGVNLELSGRFAAIGTTSLQGIEVALEVSGADIQLSVCDNQTTAEGSVSCANRFVDEGVLAVIGPIATSHAVPAANVLQPAGIIMISTASTGLATTAIGEYIFRMAYRDDFQGRVAATYAADTLDATDVVIFRQQDDDYSFGLAGLVQDAFVAREINTTMVDYVANTVDFSAQISDISGLPFDLVYFAGFCAEGATLVPQLRQAGIQVQIMGADAIDDSQCPIGGGAAFDGVIFTGFGSPAILQGAAAERAQAFADAFAAVYPDAADFNGFTLSGADSLNAVVEAIRIAGSIDTQPVLTALQNLDGFPGVSGDITYAGTDGSPADRVIGFFRYNVPGSDGSDWNTTELFGIGTAD